MPSIFKRRNKYQAHVDRPGVITANFELRYEEIVQRNKFMIIALALTGLLGLAAFIPTAVNKSTANNQRIIVEVENGEIINPYRVTVIRGDTAAGGDSYIEFAQ